MNPLHTVASEKSYEVFQLRRLRAQLGLEAFDSQRAVLRVVSGYNPRLFVADVEEEFGGDAANPNPPMRPPF